MTENKTKPTKVSVAQFLKQKTSGQQLADSKMLIKLFREITGKPAKMWGPSIVGFGNYHYVYDSGREGDAPLLGFSPRKPQTVLYVLSPGADDPVLMKKLGKYRASKACIYIRSLADLDLGVLRKLATASVKATKRRYPD